MNPVRIHIGVDVGKDSLDICCPDGTRGKTRNIKPCRTKLIKRALKIGAVTSFEATGPYEEPPAEGCLARGVGAVRLDAWGTRKYAESQGRIEKTDAIDCEMIRDYAMSLKDEKLHLIKPRPQAHKALKRAVSTRKNLMKARAIIYSQYENLPDAEMRKCLDQTLAKLGKGIARIEGACDAAIASDGRMSEPASRFQTVKGVGPCLTRIVPACCPDIGEFSDGGIAKMCGNAPIDYESCTIKKKARPKRGRTDLRKAMYMAAVSASRSNHVLRPIYRRLVAKGKPRKVAPTAIARRIAILLNNIAKHPDFIPAQDPKSVAHAALPKRGRGRPRKTA